MDEFLNGLQGRFSSSIADSIMMGILHTEMDKAHEKSRSKEGTLERLNAITRFYQLAIIQLEGCLKIVKEERDNCMLESDCERMASDLTEIQDRLCRHLKETELAIAHMDSELMDKLESEQKLRQALELRERELISLRVDLDLEGTKSTDATWEIISDYSSRNKGHEQMGSDLESLKESFDHQIEMIKETIFLSKVSIMEQQWKLDIENDVISILLKNSVRNLREILESELEKQERTASLGLLSEEWSNLMNDITSLRHELELLSSQNELQEKGIQDHNGLETSVGQKTFQKTRVDDHSRSQDSSGKAEGLEHVELPTEDNAEDEGHHVAKMIKNHESIIRKKSEEMNWLKAEIRRDKTSSSSQKDKDPDSPKSRIQRVILRLDSFIEKNSTLGAILDNYKDVSGTR